MDLHRLAEERSLEYHRVLAERLQAQPAILEAARRRAQGWLDSAADRGTPPPSWASHWARLLAGEVTALAAFMVERSELADELRQSSPFAGSLPAKERWSIWRATGDRFNEKPLS